MGLLLETLETRAPHFDFLGLTNITKKGQELQTERVRQSLKGKEGSRYSSAKDSNSDVPPPFPMV